MPNRPLEGNRLRKFIQPLPVPGNGIVVARPFSGSTYRFLQRPIARRLHPDLPPTPLFAYDDGSGLLNQAGSFGMAVVARRNEPVAMSVTNGLYGYPGWLPVDPRFVPSEGGLRTLTHLHGGFVTGASDGNPAADPDGYGFARTQSMHYPNAQPASMLWFHDHAPGATRLNVFAGLAAGYIIRDALDTGLEPNPAGLPGGAYEIPLVVQDRLFNVDGTLRYPTSEIPGATWIGEYFGDVMLVNGKAWPYLEVEPRLYRLRVLNGCNARILRLDLGGLDLWQIGGDGGLFDVPVPVKELILAPAERADVLVDFAPHAGRALLVKNLELQEPVSSPAPELVPVMQLRVGSHVRVAGPAGIPSSLPGTAAVLGAPARRRFFTLNESGVDTPGWTLNLNGEGFMQRSGTPDTIRAGDIEEWTYVNMTGDTHPMHMHLTMFQVIGRTPFDADAFQDKYGNDDGVPGAIDPAPFATGPMEPPAPEERGFKDTVKANPGYFTTVRARFDLPPGASAQEDYVQHCHILEHEDNDMMRAFRVVGG